MKGILFKKDNSWFSKCLVHFRTIKDENGNLIDHLLKEEIFPLHPDSISEDLKEDLEFNFEIVVELNGDVLTFAKIKKHEN